MIINPAKRPSWSRAATVRVDGRDFGGMIVGRCYHDGRDHYDIREPNGRIHVDVPAERIWQ